MVVQNETAFVSDFDEVAVDIIRSYLSPIATRLDSQMFPHGLTEDDYFVFCVENTNAKETSKIVDESAISFNFCIGDKFTGGEICFDDKTVVQEPMHMVAYRGDSKHYTTKTHGNRKNVIFWCLPKQIDSQSKPKERFYAEYKLYLQSMNNPNAKMPCIKDYLVVTDPESNEELVGPELYSLSFWETVNILQYLNASEICTMHLVSTTWNNWFHSSSGTMLWKLLVKQRWKYVSDLESTNWKNLYKSMIIRANTNQKEVYCHRSIVTIHVGKPAERMGSSIWELLMAEHGLDRDGYFSHKPADDKLPNVMFHETIDGRWYLRSLYASSTPTCTIAKQQHMNYYEHVSSSTEDWIDALRKEVEKCSLFQGFFLNLEVTGSSSRCFTEIDAHLHDLYPRKSNICFPVFSELTCNDSLHNSIRNTIALKRTEAAIIFENSKLFKMAQRVVTQPSLFQTYTVANDIIARTFSSVTYAMRFDGSLHIDMSEISSNLVPYPSIGFITPYLSPLIPCGHNSASTIQPLIVGEMTSSLFDDTNCLTNFGVDSGKHMGLAICYRGKDVIPRDVNTALTTLRKECKLRFVDWSPMGIRCGINRSSPFIKPLEYQKVHNYFASTELNQTAIALTNSSSFKHILHDMIQKYEVCDDKSLDTTELVSHYHDYLELELETEDPLEE
jgi:tubulin alpha